MSRERACQKLKEERMVRGLLTKAPGLHTAEKEKAVNLGGPWEAYALHPGLTTGWADLLACLFQMLREGQGRWDGTESKLCKPALIKRGRTHSSVKTLSARQIALAGYTPDSDFDYF